MMQQDLCNNEPRGCRHCLHINQLHLTRLVTLSIFSQPYLVTYWSGETYKKNIIWWKVMQDLAINYHELA